MGQGGQCLLVCVTAVLGVAIAVIVNLELFSLLPNKKSIWSKDVENAVRQAAASNQHGDPVTVHCTSGEVVGVRLEGGAFDSFLGIPYASAKRWEEARQLPNPAWNGALDASRPGSFCPQTMSERMRKTVEEQGKMQENSEDCLSLNIHRPVLQQLRARQGSGNAVNSNQESGVHEKLLPVMVWIHGGSFLDGAGSLYDGMALSAGNTVVVTVNYRLGVFGSLKLDTSNGSGAQPQLANFALTDLSRALHWIQENVAPFGGDPKRVTLFGESSGGALVGWMILGKNLLPANMITGAVLQSGTPNAPWAWRTAARAEWDAEQLARAVDCDRESTARSSCLRSKTVDELLAAQGELFAAFGEDYATPTVEYLFASPAIDSVTIEESPDHLIDSLAAEVTFPVIIGTTASEMSSFILAYRRLFEHVLGNYTLDSWTDFAAERLALAQAFRYPVSRQVSGRSEAVLQKILHTLYGLDASLANRSEQRGVPTASNADGTANNRHTSDFIRQKVIELWSDCIFVCPAMAMAERLVQRQHKVHKYTFTWQDARFPEWAGSPHTAEIDFVFGAPLMQRPVSVYNTNNVAFDTASIRFSEQVMELWTSFAKDSASFGSKAMPASDRTWSAMTQSSPQELDLGNEGLRMVVPTDQRRRCQMWKDVIHPLIELLDTQP